MFYYLYQITNNLNGKIYVGVHKTKDMNDGYMGSGKIIRSAITKHGISNFSKVILETFENAEAMYAREKEVVNEEFLLREDTYNIRRGGTGGFDYINSIMSSEDRQKYGRIGGFKAYNNLSIEEKTRRVEILVNAAKESIKNKTHNFCIKGTGKLGPGNSTEARKKSAESQRKYYAQFGHQKGETNSQFGSMWITDGQDNQKIKKDVMIPDGWRKGRTLKH